jgi:Ca-activated chloride channel family protein
MNKMVLLGLLILFSSSLIAMSKKVSCQQIDDWEYNATKTSHPKMTRITNTSIKRSIGMPAPVAMKLDSALGFSVGGAKDANNFYENIKAGYLPKMEAMTYEGIFYDHYFETKEESGCQNLFCPSYSTAISINPFTQEQEYYLSVGLASNIKADDFTRKKLNIVVVLDISGSMSAPFNRYYYDKNQKIDLSKEEQTASKMAIANEAIVSMIAHLKEDDRLGIVLFDNQAYKAKPLRAVKNTDMEAIKKHILALKERGGTNWSAGYQSGVALFDSLEERFKNPDIYENRIIFLTDAMPNRGELNQNGLFNIAKEASAKHIHTTFIGIGVDFNNDLVEAVSKTKGANYYAIHSSKAFKKRLDEEFDYMVTPLVFDLKLALDSKDFAIEAVYGSPQANRTTGELMVVNTLFPSPTDESGSRGGIIVLKLKKLSTSNTLNLHVSYHDRNGKPYHITKAASFKGGIYHDNSSIQKAILLSRYGDLIRNFTLDMRKECNDNIPTAPFMTLKRSCSIYPPSRPEFAYIKTWERKSCPLQVSAGYQKIFALFSHYFQNQMVEISDESLKKELTLLKSFSSNKIKTVQKIDDWQGRQR